jgi:SAM-dependent methyltransferase
MRIGNCWGKFSVGDVKMSFHFAWHLLYNRFPWLFDFVAGRASHGRWKEWGRSCIHYLGRGRILELGHGPGHLLILLKKAGYKPTGIDLSAGMSGQAARRLRCAGINVPLVRCRAKVLPFQSQSFDEVVATFPTDDILELNTLHAAARLIPTGGRMAMVAGAQAEGGGADPHFTAWLKGLIGQDEDLSVRMKSAFYRAGLRARIEYHSVEGSPVILVIAENRPGRYGWVNSLPTVDAGQDMEILSIEQTNHILIGTATDPDGDPLTYRWIEMQQKTILSDWETVEPDGKVLLKLGNIPPLPVGQHTLMLEVTDSDETAKDKVNLTIANSPPDISVTGGGEFEINTPVILKAEVSDYDGDLLNYYWLDGENVLARESIQGMYMGQPVSLPILERSDLKLGFHMVTLGVSDGINPPVFANAAVMIRDTIPPKLAPVPNKSLLWSPDHSMVTVLIQANALDNSEMPVRLNASVDSNEPQEGLGEGDIEPDWRVEAIDEDRGIIALQLRAERSGRGNDRQYTVTITATDHAGNESAQNIKILVSHDSESDH